MTELHLFAHCQADKAGEICLPAPTASDSGLVAFLACSNCVATTICLPETTQTLQEVTGKLTATKNLRSQRCTRT